MDNKTQFKEWVLDNVDELRAYSMLNNTNDMLEGYYKTNKRFYNVLNDLIDMYENILLTTSMDNQDLRDAFSKYKFDGLQLNELEQGCVTELVLNNISILDFDDFLDEVEKL